jgi:hypothetical protein
VKSNQLCGCAANPQDLVSSNARGLSTGVDRVRVIPVWPEVGIGFLTLAMWGEVRRVGEQILCLVEMVARIAL